MMLVWQKEDDARGPRERGQAQRSTDGYVADLIVYADGRWHIDQVVPAAKNDAVINDGVIAEGKAGSIESAKLVARLVWELS